MPATGRASDDQLVRRLRVLTWHIHGSYLWNLAHIPHDVFLPLPLEAMACATPVIGSKVGGIMYTIREAETGYLVPTFDPGAVADRLAYLREQPELRLWLGRNGVQHVRRHFRWEGVVEQLLRVYDSVCARTSASSLRVGVASV
jgi:glycosyltransferase involved in cell wall biosynthesis